MSAFANAIHALAAVIWVGGMFFAYMVLRPAMGGIEPPPQRPRLWARVFPRFFGWVWAAVFLLPATGYWRIVVDLGGPRGLDLYIHIMQGIGIVMIFLFVYLFGGPHQKFQDAVKAEDWAGAGRQLDSIRRIVGINLILGLITTAVGASGRLWG